MRRAAPPPNDPPADEAVVGVDSGADSRDVRGVHVGLPHPKPADKEREDGEPDDKRDDPVSAVRRGKSGKTHRGRHPARYELGGHYPQVKNAPTEEKEPERHDRERNDDQARDGDLHNVLGPRGFHAYPGP